MASLQSSADYLSLRAAVAKACVQDAVFIGAHEVLRTRVSFIYLFLKKLKSLHSMLRARPRAGQVAGEHWGWTDGTAYDEALIATMGHGERGATSRAARDPAVLAPSPCLFSHGESRMKHTGEGEHNSDLSKRIQVRTITAAWMRTRWLTAARPVARPPPSRA